MVFVLSKNTLERGVKWLPSAAKYGTASFLFLLFATEWKLPLMYVPFYNTKFKKD